MAQVQTSVHIVTVPREYHRVQCLSLLFMCCTSPISSIASSFSVSIQQYADDTQIYVALTARIWNEIPVAMRNVATVQTFKHRLKTHLFSFTVHRYT